jgi:hypothetical protein
LLSALLPLLPAGHPTLAPALLQRIPQLLRLVLLGPGAGVVRQIKNVALPGIDSDDLVERFLLLLLDSLSCLAKSVEDFLRR